MSRIATSLIAIAIGVLLTFLLVWCWAHIAAMNPLPTFLAKSGLSGTGFWVVVLAADFLINVALCLSAAWALWRLGAPRIRNHTLLALASFAVANAFMVSLPVLSHAKLIWANYLLLLAALPAAVWLLSKFVGNAPNKSFKPTPLRGAA